MVNDLFCEVIRLLNKLPLFSIYHKEKDMRNKYMLNWDFYLNPKPQNSMLELRGKDIVHRHNS